MYEAAERMYVNLFLLLLCSRTISSRIMASDLVQPLVSCYTKADCEELAFRGEFDCIYNKCYCINNTSYKKHIAGCFKNIELGSYCSSTEECVTPGAICAYPCNAPIRRKKCICENDAEFSDNCCKPVKGKCCSDTDCQENMSCNTEMQRCQCLPKFYLINGTCVRYRDLNICRNDNDCAHMQNAGCARKNHLLGSCECKMNYINIQNKCVKYNPCNNNKHCSKEENCYILPNTDNSYGICVEGIICREREINFNNQCVLIEDFCQNDEDCNYGEICYPHTNNRGNCVKELRNMTTDECMQDIQCKVSFTIHAECQTRLGKCVCSKGAHHYENKCYPTVRLGEICTFQQSCLLKNGELAGCVDGRCSCGISEHPVRDEYGESCANNTRLGEDCTADNQCIVANSRCYGTCRCNIGYTTNRDQTLCLKEAEKLLDPCQEDGQCETISPDAVCKSSYCFCSNRYHEHQGKCYKNVKLNGTCNIDEECLLEQFSHCKEGICTCKHMFTPDGLHCTNSTSQLFTSLSLFFIVTIIFLL